MNRNTIFNLAVIAVCLSAGAAQGQFPWSATSDSKSAVPKTGSIPWKTDLPEALELAKKHRKLVLLHFSGENCGPCRNLEANVLSRNDVALTLLSRYIPVLVVVEQAPDMVERFNVKAWPTDVFLDAEGRELARGVSPQDPKEFTKRLSTIATKHQAGLNTTMANVRAAVASDISEGKPQIQQTAGDDRKPASEISRAESKVVPNPHAKESRLPPIVSKRSGAHSPSEEGFSPPNQRRVPPIVQKSNAPSEKVARTPKKAAPVEEEAVAEEGADLAPWRKPGTSKTTIDAEEVSGATSDEEEADTETPPAKQEKKARPMVETPAATEEPKEHFEETAEEESQAESSESDEETEVSNSRFSEKDPAEKEGPSATEENEVSSDGAEMNEASEDEEMGSQMNGKQEPDDADDLGAEEETPPSRFSDVSNDPAPDSEETREAAQEKAESSKQAAPQEETAEPQKSAPETPDAYETEEPHEKADAQAKEAAPKKKTAEVRDAAPEETDDPVQEEKSARPRGLAKVVKNGKYVLDGYCCVTLLETKKLAKGNPKFGAIHRGRTYLFASADARTKFLKNPDDYSPMLSGYDPVKYVEDGELVDGSRKIMAELDDGRVVAFSTEETYKKFAADYLENKQKSIYVQSIRSAMKETNGGRHLR